MGVTIIWDQQVPSGLQLPVARRIEMILGMPVENLAADALINGYHPERNQYDASTVLDRLLLMNKKDDHTGPALLVVTHDLFVGNCDFVFGLARPQTGCAVISLARLSNSFYGRTENFDDLADRAAKEGAHELGHLFGLDHCQNQECVMFKPVDLSELDRKQKALCSHCLERLALALHKY